MRIAPPRMRRFASMAAAAAVTVGGALGAGALLFAPDRPGAAVAPLRAMPTRSARNEAIQPIEVPAPLDALGRERVALGSRLFSDPRLSADDSLACAGCHDLSHGGADGRSTSVGVHGRRGALNALSVFDADRNVKLFWDGRADSLEAQVDGPLLNPDEMGSNWDDAVRKLKAVPSYRAAFATVFPREGIAPSSIRSAIAAFERTLVTTGSRFDRFLLGDARAISFLERTGYERFQSYGCTECHQGMNVGGNVFEKLGIARDFFADRGGEILESDLGRFNVTKDEADRFKFRVPSLRTAASTAPYFHDGSVPTLEEAVALMGRYELGEEIVAADIEAIVAFLGTLEAPSESEVHHAQR